MRQPHYTDGPPPETLGFKDAPVLIFVCGDPRTVQATVLAADFQSGEGGWGAHFFKAIGNTTQIMGLAARALGLGAQWVSLDNVLESRPMTLLGVTEELEIHTIVPIGYPACEPPPPFRRELKDVVHFEKYDMSKFSNGEKIYDFIFELRGRTRSAYKRK
jgi:nitroreductase